MCLTVLGYPQQRETSPNPSVIIRIEIHCAFHLRRLAAFRSWFLNLPQPPYHPQGGLIGIYIYINIFKGLRPHSADPFRFLDVLFFRFFSGPLGARSGPKMWPRGPARERRSIVRIRPMATRLVAKIRFGKLFIFQPPCKNTPLRGTRRLPDHPGVPRDAAGRPGQAPDPSRNTPGPPPGTHVWACTGR